MIIENDNENDDYDENKYRIMLISIKIDAMLKMMIFVIFMTMLGIMLVIINDDCYSNDDNLYSNYASVTLSVRCKFSMVRAKRALL